MVSNLSLLLTSFNLKLKISVDFKYLNSLLVKQTHDTIFPKKDVQHTIELLARPLPKAGTQSITRVVRA
jgi:hypothetical protein